MLMSPVYPVIYVGGEEIESYLYKECLCENECYIIALILNSANPIFRADTLYNSCISISGLQVLSKLSKTLLKEIFSMK